MRGAAGSLERNRFLAQRSQTQKRKDIPPVQSAHDKTSLSNIAFNLFALKESSPSGGCSVLPVDICAYTTLSVFVRPFVFFGYVEEGM